MSRSYKIKIGNIWLTEDGSEDADPCLVSVNGVDQLRQSVRAPVTPAIDGTLIKQILPKVVSLEITPIILMADVFEDLLTLINSANESGDSIQIVGTEGDTGDFDVQVIPDEPAFKFKDFTNGRIENATFRFLTN